MEKLKRFTKPAIRIGLMIAVVAGLRLYVFDHYINREQLTHFITGLGLLAPLGFSLIALLSALLFLPSALIVGIGGVILGTPIGSLSSLLGLTLGAGVAFLSARYLASGFIEKLVKGKLEKVNQLAKVEGVGFVFSLRLMFFANTAVSYSTGLTRVKFRDYILGSVLGLLPRIVILSRGFEVIWQAQTIKQMVVNPYIWSLPLLQLAGALLLVVLTRIQRQKTKKVSAVTS